MFKSMTPRNFYGQGCNILVNMTTMPGRVLILPLVNMRRYRVDYTLFNMKLSTNYDIFMVT